MRVGVGVYVSHDDDVSDNVEPTGTPIFQQLGGNKLVYGDDEVVKLIPNFDVDEEDTFIKVYAKNDDDFSHTITASITIDTK